MTDDYAVPEWGTFQVRKLNEDNEKDKKKSRFSVNLQFLLQPTYLWLPELVSQWELAPDPLFGIPVVLAPQLEWLFQSSPPQPVPVLELLLVLEPQHSLHLVPQLELVLLVALLWLPHLPLFLE